MFGYIGSSAALLTRTLEDGRNVEHREATADSCVGLFTEDEALVERIGVALAPGGVRLAVGATPDAVTRLLAVFDPGLCVWDTACPLATSPVLDAHAGDLLLQIRKRHGHGAHECVCYQYRRGALPALLHELALQMPGSEVRGDAVDEILGATSVISLVREQIRSVARFADVPVLILGETGTGKELVARALHTATFGEAAPFVAINCAAIPESLLESELFGHEAGAYTGARGIKVGLFEAAAGGTIFLDEVGEMTSAMQPKLLRVLESGEFRRVGANSTRRLRARVVSATNCDPWAEKASALRSDLTYRLAGFTIGLPPLRERSADIELLANHFLVAFRERYGAVGMTLSPDAIELLSAHDWPGNIRELRAVVDHACILSRERSVTPREVRAALAAHRDPRRPPPSKGVPGYIPVVESGRLRDVERDLIRRAMHDNEGNVSRTARQLGIPRSTLRSKLGRLGD